MLIWKKSNHTNTYLLLLKLLIRMNTLKFWLNIKCCLDVLSALKYKLDHNTLEKIYFAFMWFKVEYANIVWDTWPIQAHDMIERVQYRAAKIVSGAIHCTSHNVVYSELFWERLEDHWHKQRLRVFYKPIHKETPLYVQNIVPNLNVQNQYQLQREAN